MKALLGDKNPNPPGCYGLDVQRIVGPTKVVEVCGKTTHLIYREDLSKINSGRFKHRNIKFSDCSIEHQKITQPEEFEGTQAQEFEVAWHHSQAKSGLVSTVCACAKCHMKSWGIVLCMDTAGLLFGYVSVYASCHKSEN